MTLMLVMVGCSALDDNKGGEEGEDSEQREGTGAMIIMLEEGSNYA